MGKKTSAIDVSSLKMPSWGLQFRGDSAMDDTVCNELPVRIEYSPSESIHCSVQGHNERIPDHFHGFPPSLRSIAAFRSQEIEEG